MLLKHTKKILAISAFYRSDQKDGIAISITYEVGNLNKMLANLQDQFDETFNSAVRDGKRTSEIARIKEWLDIAARERKPMDLETGVMVIGMVYLLCKYDAIPSDEFNGLLLAMEGDYLH